MSHPQPARVDYPSWIPAFETDFSTHHDALTLATVLLVGLAAITPLLSIVSGVPAVAFVVIVGGIYGALALLARRVILACYVALIITATFNANLPLPNLPGFGTGPAHLGFDLWLFHLPILGLLGYLVLTRGQRERDPSRVEMLFGGFVVWTGFAAFQGATKRPDVAIYFAFFMLEGLVVLTFFRHAIQTSLIRFRTILDVFVLTALAHSVVGIIQFINGAGFGLTTLGGRAEHRPLETFFLGPLGEIATGTHVVGFTGWPFHLATLLVLAIPVGIALAASERGWQRVGYLGVVAVLGVALRLTATDAGRGGIVLGCVILIFAVSYRFRDAIRQRTAPITYVTGLALGVFTTILITLYPSSKAGHVSTQTDFDETVTQIQSNEANTAATTATTDPSPLVETLQSTLLDLSIPFFDLTSLGVRLKQYIAATDLFVQNPLFGIGGANFPYYALDYGLHKPLAIHSIYFALLAQTGLPGLLLFLATIVAIFWAGITYIFSSTTSTRSQLLVAGTLCGIVAYLGFGLFDSILLTVVPSFIPFWILIGAVVGVARRD